MSSKLIHMLKYGVILASTAVLASSCANMSRVPVMHDYPNCVYLSKIVERPVFPGGGDTMAPAGLSDMISVLPDLIDAYENIETHKSVVSYEFFIGSTNEISPEALKHVLDAFNAVTEK